MNKCKKLLLILLLINAALALPAEAAQTDMKIVTAAKNVVNQYELFDITIRLSPTFDNPYDYNEVDLVADIIAPDGQVASIPAFYTGQKSLWKIRYTPVKKGKYSYKLVLKNPLAPASVISGQFNVTAGIGNGFLRKGQNNPHYPVFDSGKGFFGIGHNIAWATNNNIDAYKTYFKLMKENGCNLTRVWLNAPWTFRIESDKAGRYNDADAEKLDKLLDLAKEYGIHLILTLDTYSSLMEERGSWDEQSWRRNPYNKINGGPCEKPWDFFTDQESIRLYKNRLKYIIARWSYSPNIMAFELWNEIDSPAKWVSDICLYLKSTNPHGQLITTSLGYPWGNNFNESSVWEIKELDMIDRHLYGNTTSDIISNLVTVNRQLYSSYNKLLLVGEFGQDTGKSDADIDVNGNAVSLHSGLWAGALTGACATPLNWWWAEYIKKMKLYNHYKALSNFLNGTDWSSKDICPLNTTQVLTNSSKERTACPEIVIKTADAWGDKSYEAFYIQNNGDISGGIVNAYLHGTQKKDFRLEPTFHVNYPADGEFIIHIDMVSQGANLVAELDGKQVLNKELPAGSGNGPWKRSLHRKDYKIYQCIYDTKVGIDVPKGEHTIRLSNTGLDWIRLKNITLTNYFGGDCTNARIVGLRVAGQMLIWIQNKAYNWKDINNGIKPDTIEGAYFKIAEIDSGSYKIEWWNTFEGKIIKSGSVDSKNGELDIRIPAFDKDIACKIIKY
ncbi:MAG: DUF5060 domain-containing protein [Candidatus Omnitrophota bacterium]